MRHIDLRIGRTTYPLCYSTNVDLAVAEKFGGIEQLGEIIASDDNPLKKAESLAWIISQMLEAGMRYMNLIGEATPAAYPEEYALRNLLSRADMMTTVIACIRAGSEREVDVEPPKNAMATGGA